MNFLLSTTIKENLRLAWDLARRDLSSKYRRSSLGPLWLLLTPLCLLGIYSLVFGQVFGVEWRAPHLHNEQGVGFVLPFFVGLSVYLALSDIVTSSAVLFASKRTYVIKSPFPLWVIYASNLLRAGVHAGVTLALVLVLALIQQRLTMTGFIWMLASLFGATLFAIAISLLLASIGPFIGDISEAMRLLLRVLFYATPITYPISLVPQPYQEWMWLNPLTCIVEFLRTPIVFGQMPSLFAFGIFLSISVGLFGVALWVFDRVKGVISDVV
jgi:lipopolysaccharide transport system permease protein